MTSFRMAKINDWFEPVSTTDKRQRCKAANCDFISEDTTSSTGYKWKHFRTKHPKHPILENDPQRKRKADQDANTEESKQPKVRKA